MNVRVAVLLAALIPVLGSVGCKSRSSRKPDPRLQAAYQAGQQAGMQMQVPSTTVVVLGNVRKQKLLWSEGLTLSHVLIEADYLGRRNPRTIYVIRRGDRYQIDVKALLSGAQDPLIDPGDVIEVLD